MLVILFFTILRFVMVGYFIYVGVFSPDLFRLFACDMKKRRKKIPPFGGYLSQYRDQILQLMIDVTLETLNIQCL